MLNTFCSNNTLSESDVVPDVETSHNHPVNALETGFEISQTYAFMVPQTDMV
jgi:hypothetical protein